MLIDVHCHLDALRDIEKAIENAKLAGLNVIITNGINPKTNRQSLEFARKYPIVKAALGISPTDALEMSEEQIDEELEFIKKQKNNIIAIGEVGIDFHWIKNSEQQRKEINCFEKIISLAENIKKPLIVHSRKAEKEVMDLLTSSRTKKVVMHCFGGSLKLAEKAADSKWNFSIPTNVVRDNHFQKLVELIPMTQLFTETDSPYLGPEKNFPNEPANIAKSLPVIAKIKKVTKEEMEKIIFLNYQQLFL